MISILLFYKILQFFAVLILGFIVVKAGIVQRRDSVILSKLSLYLLIPAAITPTAATILQYTQICNEDADLAVAINIATTILCIATMPIFVALYS